MMEYFALQFGQLAISQFWQISLLICVTLVVVGMWGRDRPHLACGLWIIVALKCVTPPVWSSPGGIFCWLQPPRVESPARVGIRSWFTDLNDLPPEGFRSSDEGEELPEVVVQIDPRDFARAHPASELPERSAIPHSPPAEGTSLRGTVLMALAAVWCAGSFTWGLLAAWRLARCWRTWRRLARPVEPFLVELMDQLRRRLRMRQTVRVLVTDAAVAPAVVGLLRPTIILPRLIIAGKSMSELAPLLAHELVHVRRGDLWTGMLQTVARGVWWFHPLVRMASQRLTREAERCCDEEVLAELGCDPAVYARSLIDVLELKSRLTAVPAFPGVRPVEITSQRLERIMCIGQGGHRRAPWWCRLTIVLLAVGILPGAALAWREPEPTPAGPPVPANREAVPVTQPASSHGESGVVGGSGQPLIVRMYDVGDLIERLNRETWEPGTTGPVPANVVKLNRKLLYSLVKGAVTADWTTAAPTEDGDPTLPGISWFEDRLVVQQTPAAQAEIERTLDSCRRFGFEQWVTEVVVVSGDRESLRQLAQVEGAALRAQGGEMAVAPPNAEPGGARVTCLALDTLAPVSQAIADNSRLNRMSAPKLTTFNGQRATIQVASERAFIVDYVGADRGDLSPVEGKVAEGFELQLRPLQREDDAVEIDMNLTLTGIQGVDVQWLPQGADGQPLRVERPRVDRQNVRFETCVRPGTVLLVDSLPGRAGSQDGEELAILVRVCRLSDLRAPSAVHSDESSPASGPTDSSTESVQTSDTGRQLPPSDAPSDRVPKQGGRQAAGHRIAIQGDVRLAFEDWTICLSTQKGATGRPAPQLMGEGSTFRMTGGGEAAFESRPSGENSQGRMKLRADEIDFQLTDPPETQGQHSSRRFRLEARGDVRIDSPAFRARGDRLQVTMVDRASSPVIQATPEAVVTQPLIMELSGNVRLSQVDARGAVVGEMTTDRVRLTSPGGSLQVERTSAIRSSRDRNATRAGKSDVPAKLVLRAYAVADLVEPLPPVIVGPEATGGVAVPDATVREQMSGELQALADYLIENVAPKSWSPQGARGRVTVDTNTLSLVIQQTPEVHRQLTRLLGRLRDLRDLETSLEIQSFELSRTGLAELLRGSRRETDLQRFFADDLAPQVFLSTGDVRRLVDQVKSQPTLRSDRGILRGGQSLHLPVGLLSGYPRESQALLRIRPLTGRLPDQSLELTWTDDPASGRDQGKLEELVKGGDSLLVDVTAWQHVARNPRAAGVPILNKVPHASRLFKNAGHQLPEKRTWLLVTSRTQFRDDAEEEVATAVDEQQDRVD